MARDPIIVHKEWLGYVQPTGLVVSIPALLEASAVLNQNYGPGHQRFLSALPQNADGEPVPEINDFVQFAEQVLNWDGSLLVGAPDSDSLQSDLEVNLENYNETLRPTYLFDPDRYLFLEERHSRKDKPEIPHVPDGVVYRVLSKLMLLDGERLSYRTLAVEQIGSVYEAIMGFELQVAAGQSIAIKPVKRHGAPSTINLEELLRTPADKRQKWFGFGCKAACDKGQFRAFARKKGVFKRQELSETGRPRRKYCATASQRMEPKFGIL